jgi:hypothetical protein
MRIFAFIAPLAAALAAGGFAHAQSADVTVTLGPDVEVAELGAREVEDQVAALRTAVERALAGPDGLDGRRVNLVLTDLKPNRPTMAQAAARPGLSVIDSISIGGAAIEGEVIAADGSRRPVSFHRYSTNLRDVYNFTTWQDARLAFDAFARNLAAGR